MGESKIEIPRQIERWGRWTDGQTSYSLDGGEWEREGARVLVVDRGAALGAAERDGGRALTDEEVARVRGLGDELDLDDDGEDGR